MGAALTRASARSAATVTGSLRDDVRAILRDACARFDLRHAALVTELRDFEVSTSAPLEYRVLREHSRATVAALSLGYRPARLVLVGAEGIVAALAVDWIERRLGECVGTPRLSVVS